MLLGSLLLGLSGAAIAVPEVPAEFLGDWVPEAATCQSPLKFSVEPKRVVLVNGTHSKAFGNLDVCFSCEGGAKYNGQVVWLMPEFGGNATSPLIAYFNADETLGVTKVDFQWPDLKSQFPLHQVALKRCKKDLTLRSSGTAQKRAAP